MLIKLPQDFISLNPLAGNKCLCRHLAGVYHINGSYHSHGKVLVSVGGWVRSGTYLATHSSSSSLTVGARPWVVGVTGRGRRRWAVVGFLRRGMVQKSGVGLELGGSWGERGMDPLTWHSEGLEVLWAQNFTCGRFVR